MFPVSGTKGRYLDEPALLHSSPGIEGKGQYKRGAKERSHMTNSWGLSGWFLQSEGQKRKQRKPWRSLSSLVMQVGH